jgi:hypothetical protein
MIGKSAALSGSEYGSPTLDFEFNIREKVVHIDQMAADQSVRHCRTLL